MKSFWSLKEQNGGSTLSVGSCVLWFFQPSDRWSNVSWRLGSKCTGDANIFGIIWQPSTHRKQQPLGICIPAESKKFNLKLPVVFLGQNSLEVEIFPLPVPWCHWQIDQRFSRVGRKKTVLKWVFPKTGPKTSQYMWGVSKNRGKTSKMDGL